MGKTAILAAVLTLQIILTILAAVVLLGTYIILDQRQRDERRSPYWQRRGRKPAAKPPASTYKPPATQKQD